MLVDLLSLDENGQQKAVIGKGDFATCGQVKFADFTVRSDLPSAACSQVRSLRAIGARTLKGGEPWVHWPSMVDAKWGESLHTYYNRDPYWLSRREYVDPDVPPTSH